MDCNEFKCRCGCESPEMPDELREILEAIEGRFEREVIISSGYRCRDHNFGVGGSPRSKHCEGIAADIVVPGASPLSVYAYLNARHPEALGIGVYSGHIHIDMRPERIRWGHAPADVT